MRNMVKCNLFFMLHVYDYLTHSLLYLQSDHSVTLYSVSVSCLVIFASYLCQVKVINRAHDFPRQKMRFSAAGLLHFPRRSAAQLNFSIRMLFLALLLWMSYCELCL